MNEVCGHLYDLRWHGAEVIRLRHVAKDNTHVSSRMLAKSNRHYQDLHTVAGNAIRVLSPPAPMGTSLADHLHTMPPWVVEVATYCIRLGAALAMATAQLRLGEDLTVVEPRSYER